MKRIYIAGEFREGRRSSTPNTAMGTMPYPSYCGCFGGLLCAQ